MPTMIHYCLAPDSQFWIRSARINWRLQAFLFPMSVGGAGGQIGRRELPFLFAVLRCAFWGSCCMFSSSGVAWCHTAIGPRHSGVPTPSVAHPPARAHLNSRGSGLAILSVSSCLDTQPTPPSSGGLQPYLLSEI